jgi:hypothetical protein
VSVTVTEKWQVGARRGREDAPSPEQAATTIVGWQKVIDEVWRKLEVLGETRSAEVRKRKR